MAAHLRIGAVARLLGISTKTIRHYHRVGLLAEPPRTDAGYRLYTPADLVRLVRIRRLQAVGLSLAQITHVLQEATPTEALRQILDDIVTALDEEVRLLQLRRERIVALLQQPTLDVEQPTTMPTILAQLADRLPLPDARTAAIWEQDRRIFGMLESLALPDGYTQQMTTMAEQALSDPAVYHQLLAIAEQLAALADVPEDSPLVEQLVVRAQGEDWLAHIQALSAHTQHGGFDDSVVSEVMLSVLAPAQRRFLRLLAAKEETR